MRELQCREPKKVYKRSTKKKEHESTLWVYLIINLFPVAPPCKCDPGFECVVSKDKFTTTCKCNSKAGRRRNKSLKISAGFLHFLSLMQDYESTFLFCGFGSSCSSQCGSGSSSFLNADPNPA